MKRWMALIMLISSAASGAGRDYKWWIPRQGPLQRSSAAAGCHESEVKRLGDKPPGMPRFLTSSSRR